MRAMIRVLPVAVGVVASSVGCAQLAGIDETSQSNSFAVTRMSIGNMVMTAPLDLTGLQATYLVPAATAGSFKAVAADQVAALPGTWTKNLPDPTPIEVTLPDVPTPIPRVFAFPDRALSVLFAPLEHPDPSPAPDTAMLTVTAPLDMPTVAGDSFSVYTVGSWTSHPLASGTVGLAQIGPITYAFNASVNLSGRPQFDRLTMQDAFLVLRYSGAALTGVAEAMPFDQSGADMVMTPAMVAVKQDQMLAVKVSPPTFTMRYSAVRPAVAGLAMNWSLVAAPGYQVASNAGPALQSGGLTAVDTGVTVNYGNPFAARGWNTIFTLATSESRAFTPMGTTLPVTLFAGMNQFLEPSLAAPGFELTLPAGLPELIAMDGKPLSTDGQMIASPTKFVEVTFLPDNANATLFNLQLFDLLPNAAMTALEYHQVFAAASNKTTSTGEASFEVPPEIFQVGHSYTIRALSTAGGYPGLATGDLATRELPLAQSYLDSGVFTVMP
jgi:hypothetical protein